VHSALPAWLSVSVLALPFLAGAFGGLLMARAAPTLALEAAPLWGFASGALAGCATGALAAFAGGPLGDARLSVVGPSGWQIAAVGTLEMGVAAAVTAGVVNWLSLRRAAAARAAAGATGGGAGLTGAGPGGSGPVGRGGPERGGPERGGQVAIRVAGQPGTHLGPGLVAAAEDDSGHTIYLDPWAGEGETGARRGTVADHGPSALP
jgi:hypothetical protein